jgi:hypothetical protein
MTDQPVGEGAALRSWLDRVDGLLPAAAVMAMSAEEQALILELARVASRRSVRIAAPITTYAAGLAYSSMEPDLRLERLRALIDSLDSD